MKPQFQFRTLWEIVFPTVWFVCISLSVWLSTLPLLQAQAPNPSKANAIELEQQQKQLALRFGKLEELFIRMSELESAANPTRASLLMQAALMSKQLATQQRLSVAGDLLSQGQFTRAIQEQEAGRENLKKLLELLQSENRSTRLRDERTRLEEVQREIRRLEQIQRAQTARTEAGQDLKQSASDQKDIKDQLEKVATDLDPKSDGDKEAKESSSEDPSSTDPKGGSEDQPSPDKPSSEPAKDQPASKNSDAKPADEEKSENQKSGGDDSKEDQTRDDEGNKSKEEKGTPKDPLNPKAKSKDGQKPSSDPKGNEAEKSEKPSPSSESPSAESPKSESPQSKSSESKSSEPPESSEPNQQEGSGKKQSEPKQESREDKAKKRVQAAKKRMEKAQENLEKEKRDEAIAEQREAESELRAAIEELEKILRQLREEEIERSLTDVETRLRRMLDLQREVREQSERLSNLTGESRDRTLEIQANKLSIEQTKVVMEGQRALLLLQDEGSSTAFPEALQQVNSDAQTVAKRLTEGNVSSGTLAIEDEIVGALEEMLESLKQVQKKRDEKKKQQQSQQQQSGGEQEEPLVDSISELKLLKTLQLRVNRRTQSLAKQTNNQEDAIGQVADPNLRGELEGLADRQQKIHEVIREILLKAAKE